MLALSLITFITTFNRDLSCSSPPAVCRVVVRRVLQDPMPKYLLADEVGLGKTIEAGLIIREHVYQIIRF